ncbi:hypothetical protein EMIT019CA3_120051 [Bacillus pseudomycoides]
MLISLSNNSSKNFIVKVNDQNLLVNKIGSYEGSIFQVFKNTGTYSF